MQLDECAKNFATPEKSLDFLEDSSILPLPYTNGLSKRTHQQQRWLTMASP